MALNQTEFSNIKFHVKVARLPDVKRIITSGGSVRFTYRTGSAVLVSPSGEIRYRLDKRTYDAFLRANAPLLSCTQSGSMETEDLIVEWKQASPNKSRT